MQRRNNYNSNNRQQGSNNNQNRRLVKFNNGSGGKPRPSTNQSIPGEQRDVSINPKHRRRSPDFAQNIEPGDPSTFYEVTGILELHPNGYGFLRDPSNDYTRIITDPFVPGNMIERYGFREGVSLTTLVQPGTRTQGPRVREIISVAGENPDDYINIKPFDDKTPINPEEWLRLETGAQPLTTRVMDILTPLGKGQRALIVAPPRSGKTVLLHHISQAVLKNHPDVKVVILLVDERPEEVTEFRREVPGAEVVASSLDREIESHVRLSQLVIERCRRLAEAGKDVFLLLDSITRLARAFNKWVGNTGRTMSGGVDVKAMDIPKRLFATARAFEGGGSLTIVGTALIETGSRMDDLIFQEFKGTGNMELILDHRLAEQRIYPAIDIGMSGTRREEKLFPPEILRGATLIRRTLSMRSPVDAMETLTSKLEKFNSNAEFFYQFLKGTKQIVD
ncbi:MAG: transcription termination factor Rho [Planctomycetaceae bacterium]|jgi:transcription termination factor Rho|nr:transcription termination factor Rho [Planctomycetaceae bacterium]